MTTAPVVRIADDAVRFPSLESLRAAHSDLLKRYRAAGSAPDLIAEIEAFIRRGKATGALLDTEADRWAAQTQLDYWATQLYHPDYEPPDATLDEFDPLLAPELDDRLCPYVGLDSFHEEDHGRFFGRARLLIELVEKLQSVRLLAVVGPSGSGKSSLVRAGLIPLLKKNGMPGSGDWFYFSPMVPGSNPLANLARLILPPEADSAQIQNEVAQFLRDPQHLAKLIRERVTSTTVLIIDQFEEVFTLCADDAVRQMFVENLLTLGRSPETPHRIVMTMRTDFVPNVARLPDLQAIFERSLISVGPLTASELREAIETPAALIGLKFEEGVVDALLKDTLGEPAALPLLQFTLLKLWENRERNRVSWEAYRRLGGGRQALAKTADEFYDKLIPEEQVAARRILLRMVRPGEGLEVTSNRVPRTYLYQKAEAKDRIDRVLDKLIKARLVRVSEGDTAADDQVEVAHEALVRNWPRLVDWLDEERSALRQRHRLTAAVEQWTRLGKDSSALWRGALLDQARQYDDLNELETEFVQAGLHAEEAAQQAAEARRQKELADARQLADLQARAAARARRLLRIIATVGILAVTLAIAAAVFGVKANQAATESAVLAATNAAIAATAQAARNEAETAQAIARSRELAPIALNQITIDPERGLLIALEAISTAHTFEAQDALRQLLLASDVRVTLRGHTGAVYSAQYSPDGKTIVTAGQDGTARIWDGATNQEAAELRGHQGPVTSAQYAPDGKTIVTAGQDGTARIWDAVTGREVRELTGHQGPVTSAQYSPDGKTIVTAGQDGTARIWDAATGREVRELTGHADQVTSAQYSPDGKQIVTAGYDGSVRVWDTTGITVAVLYGHEGQVYSAQFSPDAKQIVTAGQDRTVRIWSAVEHTQLAALFVHKGSVYSAQYSPDGKRIVTASEDKTVGIWDAATGAEVTVLRGYAGAVYNARYSPDGKQIVTAGQDATAQIWDPSAGKEVALLRGNMGAVSSARFSSDGKRIVTASDDGTARIWDAATGREVAKLTGHQGAVTSAQYSPDDKTIVTASQDGIVRIWDAAAAREVMALRSHQNGVWVNEAEGLNLRGEPAVIAGVISRLDFGQHLLAIGSTVGPDASGYMWQNVRTDDGQTGWIAAQYLTTSAVLSAPQYSPDGKYIVTAGADKTVRIWDAATGREVRDLVGHTDRVASAQYSPDGKQIVTAGYDGSVRVWDTTTGMTVAVLYGHEGRVYSAQFSPDAKQIVTAGQDRTVRIWDATQHTLVAALFGHESWVLSAQYSPDGQQIVTASNDGTARIWDVTTGKEVAVLRGHESTVTGAQYSPDGKQIVTASSDGTARVYLVHIEDLIALAQTRVSRGLTCEERVQYLHEELVCSTP